MCLSVCVRVCGCSMCLPDCLPLFSSHQDNKETLRTSVTHTHTHPTLNTPYSLTPLAPTPLRQTPFLRAALLNGRLLNGAVRRTAAFSWTGGSNYPENGGQSLGSFALIEFRYPSRAGPGLAQRGLMGRPDPKWTKHRGVSYSNPSLHPHYTPSSP